jgi:predicted transglutaminase-like cysteine proteinase
MIRNVNLYDLIPQINNITIWNNFIPKVNNNAVIDFFIDMQKQKVELQTLLFQYRDGIGNIKGDSTYIDYLQYPNRKIEQLALSIVDKNDSNDDKMTKIIGWVIDNIEYVSDLTNYGAMEYWAMPVETIGRGTADCEDMAFLIHSLGLHAGVPYERLRTYGGLVWVNEQRLELGGHGWTVYKRETDNEWVVLDGSYYTTKEPVEDRIPMRYDNRYYDDFFYFNAVESIDASLVNRIRNPEGRNTNLSTGYFINVYV